jgi:lipopolysaccharide biosynthesis regulator YciM
MGKSLTSKRVAYNQRRMPAGKMWKEHMAEKFQAESAPINTKEQVCKNCGFKAKYKFLRCPECNEVQK